MKQVLQSLRTGGTEVADIPMPFPGRGHLLVKSTRSLVSAGTERMLVEFGKAGWVEKARRQPDKIRMVLDKIKTDGLQPTLTAVMNKLDQPLALGYCNVGEVSEIGPGVTDFTLGDRVASNGKHAEIVRVPVNLCAHIPDNVSDDEAAFTVIGAIALQGVRLIQPTLGEVVVVTGLGLIGLMAVQLLLASGCRVLGLDFDKEKLALARKFGAEIVDLSTGEDPLMAAQSLTRGYGVDAVLITASTKSNEPMHQAALMCRKRGRIVLVGVTGLELSRADFYEKELTFQVSCSYGPGRYDQSYEEKGNDYPLGFVRWTEKRNFEAVLEMMASGRLDMKSLVSHRFSIEDAGKAYEMMSGSQPLLGIILEYPGGPRLKIERRSIVLAEPDVIKKNKAVVSFIGSGNYATAVLIPAFKEAGSRLRIVASSGGVSAVHSGRKFGFAEATTDSDLIFTDVETTAIVITTRHNSHAKFVLKALAAGKHVFVEKPLCLTLAELADIEIMTRMNHCCLMVGFNRRFSPHVQHIKGLLAALPGPKSLVMMVNAGMLSPEHWTQDREVGGGRIIGEACHFVDLLRFLVGAPISQWQRIVMKSTMQDTVLLQLQFEDGSIGAINYFANGNKAFPKERLEVFAGGRVLQLDNFRKLTGFGWPGFNKLNLWRQDKGQRDCVAAFINTVEQGGAPPIPLAEIIEVSRISIEVSAG